MQMPRKSLQEESKKKKFIYCEGKSEVSYFNMLKRKYNSVNIEIVCIGEGKIKCVEDTIARIEAYKNNHKREKGKIENYVVLDADKMQHEDIDACYSLCKENNITILFSNVCFEVLILSHYIKLSADQECTTEWLHNKLESNMGIDSYQRFKGDDYSPYIFDNIQHACSNIEKLNKEYNEQGIFDLKYHNPFSSISGEVLKDLFDTKIL